MSAEQVRQLNRNTKFIILVMIVLATKCGSLEDAGIVAAALWLWIDQVVFIESRIIMWWSNR